MKIVRSLTFFSKREKKNKLLRKAPMTLEKLMNDSLFDVADGVRDVFSPIFVINYSRLSFSHHLRIRDDPCSSE